MPPRKIFDFRPRFWCRFGVKQQELDDLLPILVIVFELEAFKCSQNLKTWLCFAPQRLQRGSEKKKKEHFSQLLYLFSRCSVELSERYKYFSVASMWLPCISSVGRMVRSYLCADLLSVREGSPSKEGFHGTHETPSRSATAHTLNLLFGSTKHHQRLL